VLIAPDVVVDIEATKALRKKLGDLAKATAS